MSGNPAPHATRRVFAVWLLALCVSPVFGAQSVMTTVAKGDLSEQQTARQVVARTAAEWKAVWDAHSPEGKSPSVDLAANMVVGIFLGTKPTAGYAVEIVRTREDSGALVVEYAIREPRRDLMTAQILTQPYHLVAVPKHADPIRFVQVPFTSATSSP